MGKKSGPPAPNYAAAAQEQAKASQELALQDTYANRPTINTPWGSQTWERSSTIDPATGKPVTSWEQNISLSPQEQAALDSQMAIQQVRSGAAQELLGQATDAFKTPMNWSNLPQRPGQIEAPNLTGGALPSGQVANKAFSFGGDINTSLDGTPGEWRQKAQDAIWNLQKPMFDEKRASLETQLSNMGLARDSDAWKSEMRRLDDSEARAQLQAIETGRGEAGQLFGQDLQSNEFENRAQQQGFTQQMSDYGFENDAQQQEFSNLMALAQAGDQRAIQQLNAQIAAGGFNLGNRSGAISEEQTRRGMTLNELNALLTGQQVSMPNMPNTPRATMGQTPDLLGAAGMQYDAALNNYNARVGFGNQLMNLGGSAASAFMFSDERLKEDIREVGLLSSGVRVVHYRYRGLPGRRFIGVIAQELLKVMPEAVTRHPSGYLMVDYARI